MPTVGWTGEPLLGHLLLGVHLAIWVLFAALGVHRLHLIGLLRRGSRAAPPPPPGEWPVVTVQLPVYNERYVVERLIDAAAALDYPRDRLEIQVLDDSTDETSGIAARRIGAHRAAGLDIAHLRRAGRSGFKAGALQHGLLRARGELLAVFDADFVPPPGILRELAPYFRDADVGMVQARWEHLNPDFSALSRAQAISLDGHFVIEHAARMAGRRFFNFNGTAGLLRPACVLDAGGWQHDTLTEDLDLSYRAQLRGWRFVFAPHVACPAELPVEMNAYKAQQHRWAKGSIQVARKLLPAIWRAALPLHVKLEASIHLTINAAYLLLFVLVLLVYPAALVQYTHRSPVLTAAGALLWTTATASVLVYFGYAQRRIRTDWRRRLRDLPFAMALAIGLALNNARAVVEGLVGHRSPFLRTPKYRLVGRGGGWRGCRYRSPVSGWALLEITLAVYFAWAMVSLARAGHYGAIPFFLLYLVGFLYVGGLSVLHAASRR